MNKITPTSKILAVVLVVLLGILAFNHFRDNVGGEMTFKVAAPAVVDSNK